MYARFVEGAGAADESVVDVVRLALGPELGNEPLEEALDERLSDDIARMAIESLLRTTLAYGSPWVEPQAARRVADAFVACFAADAEYRTNGDFWRLDEPVRSGTPLTYATFDTGVVGVDDELAGMIWFLDED